LSPVGDAAGARTDSGPTGDRLIQTFVGWTFIRATFHNGWWLLVSLSMVADAGLSPSQLLVIAGAQGVASVLFEVPAGVLADTVSRKWAIVVSHILMGTAMITTGLFPSFRPLLASQMLWGISWTFSSGSDVAWITDELDEPRRMDRVLTRQARGQLAGAGLGMVLFGVAGAVAGRRVGIVAAGVAVLLLGGFVAIRFPERNFVPVRTKRWRASRAILRRGANLAVRDRTILVLVVVAVLVNGAADSFGRILPVKLISVGLPAGGDGTVWFTAISIAGFITGVAALRVIEHRIHGEAGARRAMVLGGIAGAAGLVLFGLAPNLAIATVAVLVATGVAGPTMRTVTTIWVNRRTTSEVRATMHSFLAQAEYAGEIATAGVLAALAGLAGRSGAFIVTGALFGASAVVVLAAGRDQGRRGC
jgi:MFS family permease